MNHALIPGRLHVVHRRRDAFSESTQIFKGKVSFHTDVALMRRNFATYGYRMCTLYGDAQSVVEKTSSGRIETDAELLLGKEAFLEMRRVALFC